MAGKNSVLESKKVFKIYEATVKTKNEKIYKCTTLLQKLPFDAQTGSNHAYNTSLVNRLIGSASHHTKPP